MICNICYFSRQHNIISLMNILVALKRAGVVSIRRWGVDGLTSKSIESTSLSLEGIDDIHGSNSLPLCMFGVGDSIPDDILKEHLQDSSCLLIDEARDPLDSSSPGQSPDGRLGDPLDVVPQHLPVPLGASLAESLASFTTSGHVAVLSVTDGEAVNAPD